MRMLLLLALLCAPCVYAQDDPVRLPAPKKGESAIKDGEDAFAEGRMEDAVAHFTVAIAAQPENDELYAYRAAARVALGDIDEAGEDIEKAIELESTFSLTWNTRGYIAWMKGDYDTAVENYTSAIAYAVNDRRVDTGGLAQIYQNRGVAWQDAGNNDRALLDFNACVELVPDNPAFLENRGLVYVEKELFDVAFVDFDKAVELARKSARAYVNRAFAARQMQDYEQAIRDYSQALRLKENYPQALIGRGYTWIAWDQLGAAKNDFQSLTRIEGFEAPGHTGVGDILRIQGAYEEAMEEYMKAETLAEGIPVGAVRGKVLIYLSTTDFESASSWSTAICHLEPQNVVNWYLAAQADAGLGDHDGVIRCANRGLELMPSHIGLRELRIRAYIEKRDYAVADGDAATLRLHDSAAGFVEAGRIAARVLSDSDWQERWKEAREEAITNIRKADEAGADLRKLANDPDFGTLKDDAEFKKLVGAE